VSRAGPWFVTLALFAAVHPAAAGDYAGARFGYARSRAANAGGGLAGVVLRHVIVQGAALEAAADYTAGHAFGPDLSVRTTPAALSVLLDLVPALYLRGGLGWYVSRFSWQETARRDETRGQFGFHYGAGVLLRSSRSPQIETDLCYHAVGPERFTGGGIPPRRVSLDYWAAHVSVFVRLR
jgi:hypothetical protein